MLRFTPSMWTRTQAFSCFQARPWPSMSKASFDVKIVVVKRARWWYEQGADTRHRVRSGHPSLPPVGHLNVAGSDIASSDTAVRFSLDVKSSSGCQFTVQHCHDSTYINPPSRHIHRQHWRCNVCAIPPKKPDASSVLSCYAHNCLPKGSSK